MKIMTALLYTPLIASLNGTKKIESPKTALAFVHQKNLKITLLYLHKWVN
jgi:hypothetical protein